MTVFYFEGKRGVLIGDHVQWGGMGFQLSAAKSALRDAILLAAGEGDVQSEIDSRIATHERAIANT